MEKLRQDVKEAHARSTIAETIAVLTLVVALFASFTAFTVARRSDNKARDTAKALQAFKQFAAQRRAILHQTDVRSCRSRHTLVVVFRDYLNVSIAASEKLIKSGAFDSLSPAIQQAQKDGLTRGRQFVKNLNTADCTSVPPLNPQGGRQ